MLSNTSDEHLSMKNQNIGWFYDAISNNYDQMISFDKRLTLEEPLFRNLLNKYSIKSALDAGAGSGFHSVLMAKLGVRVTAVDLSDKMLKLLRNRARLCKIDIATVQSDFTEINIPPESFDAVFCLGNSLVHVFSKARLRKTISTFANLLKPDGVLILQILNYDKILREKQCIQNIKKSEDTVFIRYYEYHGNKILFNLLTVNTEKLIHKLQSVAIRPIRSTELNKVLTESKFSHIRSASDFKLSAFSRKDSQNLIIIATKKSIR